MPRLAGKVALITGAARGQGAAAARRYVEEGARVLLADVLDEDGTRLAADLGDAAVYRHLDVSIEDDWAPLIATAVSDFDGLDILVNNAGVLHLSAIEKTRLADYERVIRVNQIGTFLGMRAAIPEMTRRGGGSIVNVSSVEGLGGMPYLIAYSASKFAIRGMTKVAAAELGERGIRVNSVHPGMIDTQMLHDAGGGVDIDLMRATRRVALRRPGRAEEVADLVVFLGSEESSYCTGAEFVADGGATTTHALSPS